MVTFYSSRKLSKLNKPDMRDTAGEVKTYSYRPHSQGQAKAGRPARIYIQQLCADTAYSLEDLPGVFEDRDVWRERVREIRAGGAAWWWWKVELATSVEGDQKAPFLIATTPKYKWRSYSIPSIAPHYYWSLPFWVFGMTRPVIESWYPGPLANTLIVRPLLWFGINIIGFFQGIETSILVETRFDTN